jgi:hypothetical protein
MVFISLIVYPAPIAIMELAILMMVLAFATQDIMESIVMIIVIHL